MTEVTAPQDPQAPSSAPAVAPAGPMAALIIVGLVLIGLAVGLRAILTTTEKKTVTTTGKPTVVTKTETAFPDSLLAALIGLGGVLVISGAFYTRVSKITVAGATIELKDYVQASNAVAKIAPGQLRAAGVSDPVEAASKTAAATQLAAARLAALRRLAKTDPDAFAALQPETEPERLRTFGAEEPEPSAGLAEHAASSALADVLGEDAGVS
jgi:hypothetical protein